MFNYKEILFYDINEVFLVKYGNDFYKLIHKSENLHTLCCFRIICDIERSSEGQKLSYSSHLCFLFSETLFFFLSFHLCFPFSFLLSYSFHSMPPVLKHVLGSLLHNSTHIFPDFLIHSLILTNFSYTGNLPCHKYWAITCFYVTNQKYLEILLELSYLPSISLELTALDLLFSKTF